MRSQPGGGFRCPGRVGAITKIPAVVCTRRLVNLLASSVGLDEPRFARRFGCRSGYPGRPGEVNPGDSHSPRLTWMRSRSGWTLGGILEIQGTAPTPSGRRLPRTPAVVSRSAVLGRVVIRSKPPRSGGWMRSSDVLGLVRIWQADVPAVLTARVRAEKECIRFRTSAASCRCL